MPHVAQIVFEKLDGPYITINSPDIRAQERVVFALAMHLASLQVCLDEECLEVFVRDEDLVEYNIALEQIRRAQKKLLAMRMKNSHGRRK